MKLWEKIKDNFNLNGVDQVYFWKSEWEHFDPQDRLCTVSIKYLIYRFLFAAFFIAATAYNLTCTNLSYYFIFFTNWTFTIQLIYSVIYLMRLIWVRFKRREVEDRLFASNTTGFSQQPILPWPEKIIWIFVNVVSVIPYGVSSIYWLFLFSPAKWGTETVCSNAGNLLVHAMNSVMALLDSAVMAVPIRITHIIFPVTVSVTYAFFSGFYEIAGGSYPSSDMQYIYSILDWKNKPGFAIISSIGAVTLSFICHIVACWGTYRLRVFAVNKFFARGQNPNARVTPENIHQTNSHPSNSQNVVAYTNPGLVEGDEDKISESEIIVTNTESAKSLKHTKRKKTKHHHVEDV